MSLNANPIVYESEQSLNIPLVTLNECLNDDGLEDLFREYYPVEQMNDDVYEALTEDEVFTYIRHINDPEHPLTLEQQRVAQKDLITVRGNCIDVQFTPTIPHCSMATQIGLCIRVKLLRSLPNKYKIHVSITPGTHAQEDQVNKQLNDKERVAAALENTKLLEVVAKCINQTDPHISTINFTE